MEEDKKINFTKELKAEIKQDLSEELKAEIKQDFGDEIKAEMETRKIKRYITRLISSWLGVFVIIYSLLTSFLTCSYVRTQVQNITDSYMENQVIEELDAHVEENKKELTNYLTKNQKIVNDQITNFVSKTRQQVDDRIKVLMSDFEEKLYNLDETNKDLASANQLFAEIISKGKEETIDKSREIPSGWTFFSQKYRNSKRFKIQNFRVVIRAKDEERSSDSFPVKGDTVMLSGVKSQAIRKTPPTERGRLGQRIGEIEEGSIAIVSDVKQKKDTKGLWEVWILIKPPSASKL